MLKEDIRRSQIAMRDRLSTVQKETFSQRAQAALMQQSWFAAAQVIALYSPIRNEVATQALFDSAIALGKRIAFPRIDDGRMVFVEVNLQHGFCLGAFGVPEPVGADVVSVCAIDLIVVPGVAFDRHGFRIGFGKGFYDQALENRPLSCQLVGLGYAFQVEDFVPREAHDVGLDWLVTDQEVIKFDGGVNL